MNRELFISTVVSERVPTITPACMLVCPGSLTAKPSSFLLLIYFRLPAPLVFLCMCFYYIVSLPSALPLASLLPIIIVVILWSDIDPC